jgi:hypothetical protein
MVPLRGIPFLAPLRRFAAQPGQACKFKLHPRLLTRRVLENFQLSRGDLFDQSDVMNSTSRRGNVGILLTYQFQFLWVHWIDSPQQCVNEKMSGEMYRRIAIEFKYHVR